MVVLRYQRSWPQSIDALTLLQIQTPMRGGGRPGRGEWAVGMLEEKMAGIERDLGMHFGERLVGVSRDVHG